MKSYENPETNPANALSMMFHRLFVKPLTFLNQNPVMLKIGSFHLVYFGLFAALGFMASASTFFFYLYVRDSFAGLPVLPIALLYILADMVGVKAIYFVTLGKDFFQKPLSYLNETTMYNQGGLFGILAIGIGVALVYDIKLLIMFDALSMAGVLGLFWGRLGCFNYGCCFGLPTNGLVHIVYHTPNSKVIRTNPELRGVPLVPTQLYSAYFDLLMFVLFVVLTHLYPVDGLITLVFIILFNGFRMTIQRHRFTEPSDRMNFTKMAGIYLVAGLIIWMIAFMTSGGTMTVWAGPVAVTPVSWALFLLAAPMVLISTLVVGMVAFLFYGVHGRKLGTHVNLSGE